MMSLPFLPWSLEREWRWLWSESDTIATRAFLQQTDVTESLSFAKEKVARSRQKTDRNGDNGEWLQRKLFWSLLLAVPGAGLLSLLVFFSGSAAANDVGGSTFCRTSVRRC